MRIAGTKSKKKVSGLALLAGVGFVAGLILTDMSKNALLDNTGFLSEYMLFEMKYSVVDGSAFFWYVLRRRVGLALVVAVLSTTWLGLAAVWTGTLWLGLSLGMLVMTAFLRYGVKGILLILVGLFPQGIIYFPAALFILRWCYSFCLLLYYPERLGGLAEGMPASAGKKALMRKMAARFFLLLGAVTAGCFLESYVNPRLVFGFLKIF